MNSQLPLDFSHGWKQWSVYCLLVQRDTCGSRRNMTKGLCTSTVLFVINLGSFIGIRCIFARDRQPENSVKLMGFSPYRRAFSKVCFSYKSDPSIFGFSCSFSHMWLLTADASIGALFNMIWSFYSWIRNSSMAYYAFKKYVLVDRVRNNKTV